MKSHCIRFLCVVLTLAAMMSPQLAAAQRPRAATQPLSLSQLETAISVSVASKVSPNLNSTIPPLSKVSAPGNPPVEIPAGHKFPWSCYPDSAGLEPPSSAATTCAWGDVSSSQTVLLTGDSQAASWLAAMNVVGIELHFKVVFLGEPGCAPWGDPNPPSFVLFGTVTSSSCDTFRQNILAVAKSIHPSLVLLDGRAYPKGSDEDVKANLSDFEKRVTKIVSEYKAINTKVAILGPIPFYNHLTFDGKTPAYCLGYVSPITSCEFSPKVMIDPIALGGETAVSKSQKVIFVNTEKLFCTNARCALFVKSSDGNHLVYLDQYHMNRWYSAWIGHALSQLLEPLKI